MSQAGPEIVTFVIDEDLGFVFETPKGVAVDDPVPIPLKCCSGSTFMFRMDTPTAFLCLCGKGRRRGRLIIAKMCLKIGFGPWNLGPESLYQSFYLFDNLFAVLTWIAGRVIMLPNYPLSVEGI